MARVVISDCGEVSFMSLVTFSLPRLAPFMRGVIVILYYCIFLPLRNVYVRTRVIHVHPIECHVSDATTSKKTKECYMRLWDLR